MVAIRAFRALRYNPTIVGDLSSVISPPYDVIDCAEQERLYASSPHNMVRLILGKEEAGDDAQNNRYTRARRDFDNWKKKRALLVDEWPAIYIVEHRFSSGGKPCSRLGFIALLELTDALSGQVYRHEHTLSKPKEDRTRLLEALPANLEPIFCIYPDKQRCAQSILREAVEQSRACMQAAINGEDISAWAISDTSVINKIAAHLADVSILIADGHHRFEVAMSHRQSYKAIMCYLVSMEDPSLVVRPIHRVVRSQEPLALKTLQESLIVEKESSGLPSLMDWLMESTRWHGSSANLSEPSHQNLWCVGESDKTTTQHRAGSFGHFGYCDGKSLYRLSVKPERLARWLMAPTVPLALATLDVSILHGVILPDLGIAEADIQYTADIALAYAEVQSPDRGSAWFLPGIPLRQVYVLASQGLILPPKSTYFYPKVPSGLTINLYQPPSPLITLH